MTKATPINLADAFSTLTRLQDRTPASSAEDLQNAFRQLSDYRDGGAFIATFAGHSSWERHANGDELVYAVEGKTELVLLISGAQRRSTLQAGELVIIPANTWHRFETTGIKLLTLTPQPTEHSTDEVP